MTALWLDNLLAYSLQLGVLVGSGTAIAWAVGLRSPRAGLGFWRAVASAALLLPVLQLGIATHDRLPSSSTITFVADTLGSTVMPAGWPGPLALLVVILVSGAALRLSWLALGLVMLRRFEAQSEALADSEELVSGLRPVGATARLRVSDDVEGPATIGFRRPLILLPRRVLDLPLRVQRAIVCHELIHVRRHDWLQTLGEEICCAAFWFHPAVRVLASRLNLSREMVVDELTIAHTRDRRAYAEALLAFADARPAALVAVAPLIRRRHLSQRIAFVLQEVPMSRSRVAVACTCAAIVVALTTVSAVDRFPINLNLPDQSPETPYQPGGGVTLPKVIREVKPVYTEAALEAKIQGSVTMNIVVLASGDVGEVTILKSLDREFGLDEQAMTAARQWRFDPGKKDGKPVPVQVALEMTFTLKK